MNRHRATGRARCPDAFDDVVEGALALIAQSLARIADRPFPFAMLDRVVTVAELTNVVRVWAGAPV
jgi:hypothetical protein